MTDKLLLSADEVAMMLGCGRTYVFELISEGLLESVKIGRLRRVPTDAVVAYVEQLRVDARAERGDGA